MKNTNPCAVMRLCPLLHPHGPSERTEPVVDFKQLERQRVQPVMASITLEKKEKTSLADKTSFLDVRTETGQQGSYMLIAQAASLPTCKKSSQESNQY